MNASRSTGPTERRDDSASMNPSAWWNSCTDLDDIAGDVFAPMPSTSRVSLADLSPCDFLAAILQDLQLAFLSRPEPFATDEQDWFLSQVKDLFIR